MLCDPVSSAAFVCLEIPKYGDKKTVLIAQRRFNYYCLTSPCEGLSISLRFSQSVT